MHQLLNALNTPRRRELLRLVWDQEMSVSDLCNHFPDITMGAVSQHLRVLERADLLECRKDGVRRLYHARKDVIGPLRSWLESMWDSALYRLKIRAELEDARRGPQPAKRRKKRK